MPNDLLTILQKSACARRPDNQHLFEKESAKLRRPKYRNKKVIIDGLTFDSKKEARRYVELRMLQTIGEITELRHHEVFQLSVCKYEADFTYRRNGVKIVEDIKSPATRKLPTYRLKLKMMKAELGIEINEV